MNSWDNFFVSVAGASAALSGLIFVAVSINLARILSLPHLPGRASASLILLITVLITSILCLIPGQSATANGLELLATGLVLWVITLRLDLRIYKNTGRDFKKYAYLSIAFTQISVLPYIVSGIVTLCIGYPGLYWLVPGIIFSFIKSVIDAWVLLVEVNR